MTARNFLGYAGPGLVAALLSIPRLGLGYFWDDYNFLTLGGSGNPFHYLLPDPTDAYYRPIPQGIYANFLRLVDPHSGLVGHAINLVLLVLATTLLTVLVTKLAGRWAGLLAGFAFASLGAIPSLVAWISGSHDLFAIVFLLTAMLCRDANKNVAALAAAACALLSKESAIAFLPVLVFWDALTGRRPARIARDAVAYGLLTLAWAAIHPGVRALLSHGLQSGAAGYVGLEHPERWALYAARYLATLVNLPVSGTGTPWPAELTAWGAAALVLLVAALAMARGARDRSSVKRQTQSTRGLIALGILLAIPPLLLPTLLVRPWVPYLVAPAALGASLLLALGLRRAPLGLTIGAMALFLVLGVWCRGVVLPGELAWSEPVLVDASRAIRRVENNLRTLHPTLPRGAQVLVSTASTGTRGIHSTLLGGQALRIWYADPTLRTELPERRAPDFPQDILLRVTSDLDIVEIDPDACRYRSTTRSVSPNDVGRPISTYARGVAASGDPDRAVRILEQLASFDQDYLRSYDLRLAAMVSFWAGRSSEAARLMAAAEPLPREPALDLMARVFGAPTVRADLDSCAFQAFGVSPDDPGALRHLMKRYSEIGYAAQAEHFARRLEAVLPGDREAAEVLRSAIGGGR